MTTSKTETILKPCPFCGSDRFLGCMNGVEMGSEQTKTTPQQMTDERQSKEWSDFCARQSNDDLKLIRDYVAKIKTDAFKAGEAYGKIAF